MSPMGFSDSKRSMASSNVTASLPVKVLRPAVRAGVDRLWAAQGPEVKMSFILISTGELTLLVS